VSGGGSATAVRYYINNFIITKAILLQTFDSKSRETVVGLVCGVLVGFLELNFGKY
jgi:hypothetical protein